MVQRKMTMSTEVEGLSKTVSDILAECNKEISVVKSSDRAIDVM